MAGDVVQIFRARESLTRLLGAMLQEQHEEWFYDEPRYLSEISMRKLLDLLPGILLGAGLTDDHSHKL